MPWEKQYREIDVLDLAMEAFWARGYAATSVTDLVEATGLNRGSLYAAFSDKRTLFITALRHYDRKYRHQFLSEIAEHHPPRDAILAAFLQVISSSRGGRNRKGCLLVNTALEMSPHDPEISRVVSRSLKDVEQFFRDMIEAAQGEGTVRPDIPSKETACILFTLFLGLRVITRSGPDTHTMNSILHQAESLLT